MSKSNGSKSQRKALAKYQKSLASITFRVRPEYYARLQSAAEASGSSVRGFIIAALDAKMTEVLGPVSVSPDEAHDTGENQADA